MEIDERQETVDAVTSEIRRRAKAAYDGQCGWPECWHDQIEPDEADEWADRIDAAVSREISEIVSTVSELREGMCLHCDLQDQCADGEDGMPTTCNAMAKVNNFINRYKKVETRDECPF